MRFYSTILAVIALTASMSMATVTYSEQLDSSDESRVVVTQSGPVRGAVKPTTLAFLGIPYAKPPVGDLRWRALHIPFVSTLTFDGSRAKTTKAFRRSSAPALKTSFERELYRDDEGYVLWRCLVPRGESDYAEFLEMTIAPWRLPINMLRWGRIVTAKTSLVWIEWSGARPLMLALHDGREASVINISDDEVRLADGTRLAIADRTTLREAPLSATLGPLRFLLPRKLTAFHETKWRSRGTIFNGDEAIDGGWVIHERVRFAND